MLTTCRVFPVSVIYLNIWGLDWSCFGKTVLENSGLGMKSVGNAGHMAVKVLEETLGKSFKLKEPTSLYLIIQ